MTTGSVITSRFVLNVMGGGKLLQAASSLLLKPRFIRNVILIWRSSGGRWRRRFKVAKDFDVLLAAPAVYVLTIDGCTAYEMIGGGWVLE
jgi:hypothetical protein